MINRRKTNQRQEELFLELNPFDRATLPDLPSDKEIELKSVIADLLLHAASGSGKAPKGGDHDA